TIPVWMIVLQIRQKRPTRRTVAGIVLGLGGVALLVVPAGGSAVVDPLGGLLLVLCSLSWAIGSLSSRASLPQSSVLTTALQLLGGGVLASIVGLAAGEWSQLAATELTTRSVLAFAYLTIFGTLVTFTAYSWLLQRCEAAAVGSYAFVNPVVAVFVGWALGGESLTTTSIAAAGVIVAGVYLVVTSKKRKPSSAESSAESQFGLLASCDCSPAASGAKAPSGAKAA
ncbi:MAG: EamA family transporter, partial [Acidobacteriota bacterium]